MDSCKALNESSSWMFSKIESTHENVQEGIISLLEGSKHHLDCMLYPLLLVMVVWAFRTIYSRYIMDVGPANCKTMLIWGQITRQQQHSCGEEYLNRLGMGNTSGGAKHLLLFCVNHSKQWDSSTEKTYRSQRALLPPKRTQVWHSRTRVKEILASWPTCPGYHCQAHKLPSNYPLSSLKCPTGVNLCGLVCILGGPLLIRLDKLTRAGTES